MHIKPRTDKCFKYNALPSTWKLPGRNKKVSHYALQACSLPHLTLSVSKSCRVWKADAEYTLRHISVSTRHEHRLFATVSNTSFPRELQHHLVINSFLWVSKWVLPWQTHRKSTSSWARRLPRSLRTYWQYAVESTPGHRLSCSLPSFPVCYFLTQPGIAPATSGCHTVRLSGHCCRQTGKQSSCSPTAAECRRKGRKGGGKKAESEKASCSETKAWVGENHSPPVPMLRSEGSQSALQTRTAGSFLLPLEHDTLLEIKMELHNACAQQFSARGFLLRSSVAGD